MKKHVIIGSFLMIAGILMSPFFLPDDLITEPLYFAFFTGMFGAEAGLIAFGIWTAFGYLLFIIGMVLTGKGLHGLGVFGSFGNSVEQFIGKHPKTIAILFFGVLLLTFIGVLTSDLGVITIAALLLLLGAFAYLLEVKNPADRTFIILLCFGVFLLLFTGIEGFQVLNPSLQNLFP